MSKLTLYFKDKNEYDQYWGDRRPSAKYICIIGETVLPNGDIVTNSALTETNNIEAGGEMQSIGTSAITYAYSYATLDIESTELFASYSYAEAQSEIIKG